MLMRSRFAVGLMAFGAALPAFAQSGGIDVSTVTTAIGSAATAIGLIGAAVVAGPRIVSATWKWIGRALG